ncbi:hypothetical protein KQH21_31085 [Streptomyces sp. IpFD-1.1]|uniref:hypothetical protein n=1 Tax=unclassified Streptomyces TaxID=2593676 RepID=UPI0014369F76|nr:MULTISPECIES: hypothetical protein [unclassified Streptomyces]MBV7255124.1 hypothetical protein [Streptomyces sp. S-2]MCO6752561.1 hypothetical protein [Streptomyces sp. IpFD-1.1]
MTAPLTTEPGRRVIIKGRKAPGVITGTDEGVLLVRVDGTRCSQPFPRSGLQLLEEIGPVPALPKGPFLPTAELLKAEIYEGVAVVELDGGDLLALDGDPVRAAAAMRAHERDYDRPLYGLVAGKMQARRVVFVWEPEGAECEWVVEDAEVGTEQAVQVRYVPR